MGFDIRPITVPERLGDAGTEEFERYAALTRELELATWGHDHFAYSAPELHVRYADTRYRGRSALGAWTDGELVGCAELVWEQRADARMAEMTLGVLPASRLRGIGGALLDAAEQVSTDAGRPVLVGWSDHAGAGLETQAGDVLRAPDGDATIPADLPAARFAVARGYGLAQIERVSGLTVAGRGEKLRRDLAAAEARAAASGYRLVTWQGGTPQELVDAYAAARERMALDVPAGGLTIDAETWDAARVRAYESERADSGTVLLLAAAVTDDGTVAGYTELELPEGRPIAYQSDTLVVGAHRGHRLGMLVKLANLLRLLELAPDRPDVYTWNADENDHMLAINTSLGFELRGLAASWQRS